MVEFLVGKPVYDFLFVIIELFSLAVTVETLHAGSFLSKKLCSKLHSIEVDFYSKKGKVRFLSHPLGDLEVTYALHL